MHSGREAVCRSDSDAFRPNTYAARTGLFWLFTPKNIDENLAVYCKHMSNERPTTGFLRRILRRPPPGPPVERLSFSAKPKTLEGEFSYASYATEKEHEVFRGLNLGTYKSIENYRQALNRGGFLIGKWGGEILNKILCAQEEKQVDLVVMTVNELGFLHGARYEDICAKALAIGLELCPAEIGPALRLSYKDQPSREWLYIAMEPITDSVGDGDIFAVVHNTDHLWLGSVNGSPGRRWSTSEQFVFVRPANA